MSIGGLYYNSTEWIAYQQSDGISIAIKAHETTGTRVGLGEGTYLAFAASESYHP